MNSLISSPFSDFFFKMYLYFNATNIQRNKHQCDKWRHIVQEVHVKD